MGEILGLLLLFANPYASDILCQQLRFAANPEDPQAVDENPSAYRDQRTLLPVEQETPKEPCPPPLLELDRPCYLTLSEAIATALEQHGSELSGIRVTTNPDGGAGSMIVWPSGTYRARVVEEKVISVISEVDSAYWNLYEAYLELYSHDQAIHLAQELYALAKTRFEMGNGTLTDYVSTRGQYKQFCSDRVQAEGRVHDAECALRRLIMSVLIEDGRQLVPVDAPPHATGQPTCSSGLVWECKALEARRAQRAAFAEGVLIRTTEYLKEEITAESLVETQRQWAEALKLEHHTLAECAIAQAKLELARGNLLRYHRIEVREGVPPELGSERAIEHERERGSVMVLRRQNIIHKQPSNLVEAFRLVDCVAGSGRSPLDLFRFR